MAKDASDAGKPAPLLSAKALAEQQARQEREAAALRANLRKRKDQARARETSDTKPKPA